MKKLKSAGLIALAATLALAPATFSAATKTETAKPSSHVVYVNGEKTNAAAYNIGGNNFFKLRDLAAVVDGTEKQFEVTWNEAERSVEMQSGKAYTKVGGELGAIAAANRTAKLSTDKMLKDGKQISVTAYNVDGNNFFKLRDVASQFDFGIGFDEAAKRVDIVTAQGYDPDVNAKPEQKPTEQREYRNGFWIDGVVKDASGKEVAIIIGGKEYKNGDQGETEGRKFMIEVSETTGRLLPLEITGKPDVNDLKPEEGEVPAVGQYTQEYTDYLNSCGEEIVEKQVKYKLIYMHNNQPYDRAEKMIVKMDTGEFDNYLLQPVQMNCMTIQCRADGTGEFTFKMPRSKYNEIMAKKEPFKIYFPGFYIKYDEQHRAMLGGGTIDDNAMEGYRIQFRVNVK